ncbi:MAG: hypothetical protein NTY74_14710 [Ignavibacteriae bacterium]|nr:hypothetical protein [Ignavibacteriota bacterium]
MTNLIQYKTLNYIGYTATPYANILNETEDYTLFPKDFICSLEPSSYYFGPSRIIGIPNSKAIKVIRDIPSNVAPKVNDLNGISEVHEDHTKPLPQSLKEAVCWYLCCAATFRCRGTKLSSSMLIHTSQLTGHHSNMRLAVENWLRNSKVEVSNLCRTVWERETKDLTLSKFVDQCNEIEGINPYPDKINDYPDYNEVSQKLEILLSNVSNIKLGDNDDFVYHDGVHICEDNCKSNYTAKEGFYMRLIYPNQKDRKFSHAFIVIGGNTLSRGLTLEGLVSSYFLRTRTTAIDTLTQMGRWFGFRRGYELLPRIWMTDTTFKNFQKIALSENSLREEIIIFSRDKALKPVDYSPRILTHPDSVLNPTSINRMYGAEFVNLDYRNNILETTLFEGDAEILRQNKEVVSEFLVKLNNLKEPESRKSNKLWRGISGEIVRSLFNKYMFNDRSTKFKHMDLMIKWIKECEDNGLFENWNVALCGPISGDDWDISNGLSIKKRNFNAKHVLRDNCNYYSFRRFREHIDLLVDSSIYESMNSVKMKVSNIYDTRNSNSLDKTPLLLVNCVNKEFKDIHSKEDFVGFTILFPSIKGKEGAYIATPIEIDEEFAEFDIDDDMEEK